MTGHGVKTRYRKAVFSGSSALAVSLVLVCGGCSDSDSIKQPVQAAAVGPSPGSMSASAPSDPARPLFKLNVVALGSMLGSDPAAARALLSVDGGAAFDVVRGSQLAPDISVIEISSSQVVLGSGVHRRVLPIEGRSLAVPPADTASTTSPQPQAGLMDDVFRKALKDLPQPARKD
jgi:hypothetical protein